MKQLLQNTAAGARMGGSINSQKGTAKAKSGVGKTLLGSVKSANKYADWTHEEVDPPVCLSVRLIGHSFAPGSQPFIPMIKMSNSKI